MCGRFTLISNMLHVTEHFKLSPKYGGILVPRYNIAPNQAIPIISNHYLEFSTWGIKLSSIPDSLIINAKFETVLDKKLFKTAFKHNRCLIPANGFFEWKTIGKQKVPYYIQVKNQSIFGIAGLVIGDNCVILTTATLESEHKEVLHPRMPLIIKAEYYAAWLNVKSALTVVQDPELLLEQNNFVYFPVTRQVNNVKFDNPLCIKSLIT